MILQFSNFPQQRPLFLGALFILIVVCLGATSPKAGTFIQDPGVPDTLMIDSVRVVIPSPVIRIPINFFNDEQLAAMEVTIKHSSNLIAFDSASFAGGRVAYLGGMDHGYRLLSNAITMYALVTTEPLIGVGGGLFATVYCHPVGTITPQVISIDTITVLDVDIEYSTSFSDAVVDQIRPQVKHGHIDFQNTCCVANRGNVDNSPDDIVDIADLQYLIDFLMATPGSKPPECAEEANVDGSPDGTIDVSDIAYLVDYLMLGNVASFPPCP